MQKIEAYQEESKTDKFIMEVVDYVVKHLLPSESLFVTKTVHELLWGYQDSLLTDIMKAQQIVHKKLVNSDRFGLGVSCLLCMSDKLYCAFLLGAEQH